MREYEFVYIVQPDVEQERLDEIHARAESTISGGQGQVLLRDDWGKRRLAYEIQKFQKGHYFLVEMLGDGKFVSQLERDMRLDPDVLRYLTILVEDEVKDLPERLERAKREAAERAERRAERERLDRERQERERAEAAARAAAAPPVAAAAEEAAPAEAAPAVPAKEVPAEEAVPASAAEAAPEAADAKPAESAAEAAPAEPAAAAEPPAEKE